ncbi:MAG: four helix bundle protein [bacterium]
MEDKFSRSKKLEERTASFGINIINLCKSIKITPINSSIVNQMIRAATSVGANYMEANGASSRKDFRNKIYICKKEAQESKHWLKMLSQTNSDKTDKIDLLSQEAQEFCLIFTKITGTLNEKMSK